MIWNVQFLAVQGERIMATQTTSRPPLPPFTRETAAQKVRLAEDGWNTRDPAKVALAYAIDSQWRNRSELVGGRTDIIAFSLASGPKNSTTGSSRKCGHSQETALRCALLTTGTMTRVIGIGPMAMRTGSSMTTGSWRQGMHQSTTSPF
jgi:hypothetical protein